MRAQEASIDGNGDRRRILSSKKASAGSVSVGEDSDGRDHLTVTPGSVDHRHRDRHSISVGFDDVSSLQSIEKAR